MTTILTQGAKQGLPSEIYDFIAGGAGREQSLKNNISSLDRLKLVSRVLRGIENVDIKTSRLSKLFRHCSTVSPLLIAPTAHHKLVHPEGEMETLAAANQSDTPLILSTMSDTPMERVCKGSRVPIMLQLYLYKDRGVSRSMIQQAQEAGCSSLVLTVDMPRMGNRLRDRRNRFSISNYSNDSKPLSNPSIHTNVSPKKSNIAGFVAGKLESAVSWADIDWIKDQCSIPLVLKGVLHPLDAEIAQQHEVDALYLSNHGGRQLDHHISAIDTLPQIRQLVGESMPLIIDGGIRSGVDILKTLALGADAVGIGRPVLWGLAVAGGAGAASVLQQLTEDSMLAMHICGCASIADIKKEMIWTS